MATSVPGRAVEAADKAMLSSNPEAYPRAAEAASKVSTQAKHDPSGKMMQAVTWTGTKSVKVTEIPVPAVTDEHDAIIRMTSTAICGSDLHLYLNNAPGMKSGQVLGHEPMGIVESVGNQVKGVKKGDRVVCSFCIACGDCFYCKRQLFSSCDVTNPSVVQEKMMGARTAGLLGHPTAMGSYDGGQAEYFRIPFADVNCLVLPSEQELPDEKVLFLSDILPTAWHGTELACIERNDVVAVWGAGPVGILTAQCAFARGARRVFLVDNVRYRLDFAKKICSNVEVIDFSSGRDSAEKQILDLCRNEPAGAPDAVIECVGMHYAQSFMHRIEMALGLETDSPEALNSALMTVRKGGHVAAIGAYVGYANHFNIGALMEKGLHVSSGQTPVQRYWKDLLQRVQRGELDPSSIVTHHMKLEEAAQAYEMFNSKSNEVVKIVLHPAKYGK